MPKHPIIAARFALLLLVSMLMALPMAAGASTALMQRMVGGWEEHSPGQNYFVLGAEGQAVIHLKPGQVDGRRTLEADWWVEGDGMLMMALVEMDRVPYPVGKISFDGEEMLIQGGDGTVTRNRRTSQPPPEYVW
jgi:hypothetical protein